MGFLIVVIMIVFLKIIVLDNSIHKHIYTLYRA